MVNIQTIQAALDRRPSARVSPAPQLRWASVAVILRPNLDILLIRRAEREGDPWSGHMAFPGGRAEPQDDGDLSRTAARETWEEVGLDLSDARLVGRLDDTVSPSRRQPPRLAISAFVFSTPHADPPLRPNVEVAGTYWMHLSRFLDQEGRTTMPFHWKGTDVTLPAVYLEDAHIWGLTLRVLDDLTARLRG